METWKLPTALVEKLCIGSHNDHLDTGAYISTPIVQNCTQTLSSVHLHLKTQKQLSLLTTCPGHSFLASVYNLGLALLTTVSYRTRTI